MADVQIVGAAEITVGDPGAKRLEELVFEVSRQALDNAGLERVDIDAVVLTGSDELDGRSISSMLTSAPAGGLLKDTVKITDSGLHAVAASVMRLMSGDTAVELVVGWCVPSEADPELVERTALEPFVERHAGVTGVVGTGLLGSAYLEEYDRKLEELDHRASAKWLAASVAPQEIDDTFATWPLRHSHIAPTVDAAAAVVLAGPSAVPQIRRRGRGTIRGLGWCIEPYSLGERRRTALPALTSAAESALDRAGVQLSELDSVELEDRTVIHELLAVEAFGLARSGEALDLFDGPDREIVNRRSGDGFAGLPMHCSGLWRLARVMGEDRVGKVAIQNACGLAAQSHAVVVLEGNDV